MNQSWWDAETIKQNWDADIIKELFEDGLDGGVSFVAVITVTLPTESPTQHD
jgi:hypothetical protein